MICKQWKSVFKCASFMVLASAVSMSCAKKEEEEEDSDPLMGVWSTSCERFFADDTEITSPDFCYDADEIVGTQDAATTNVEDCTDKYTAYSFIDTVTFRDKSKAIKATSGKVLSTLPDHNQVTYTRVTYSDDECEDAVATLTQTFSYQAPSRALQKNDDVEDDPKNKFPADASGMNFQRTGAALTYEDDSTFDDYQISREVCTNDDWEEGSAFDILSVDNCVYNPFMMTDKLGGDVGYYNLVETSAGSGIYVSYVTPNTSGFTPLWADSDSISSSFIEGEELYSIYKIDTDEDPKQLSLGDFFDNNPFGNRKLWYFGIYPEDDSELVETTSINADGDNDNHRQRSFSGNVFEYDAAATAKL